MNILLMIISLIIVCIIGFILGIFITKRGKNNENIPNSPVDINIIENNKQVVNLFLDKLYNETLFYYLNKEITFDEESVVKIQGKFKYRNCIRNLIRPNVLYSGSSFKNIFIQRICLLFISTVPSNIKNLIYSFDSGYTLDNYWDKKKTRSIQPYIIDYINKKINNSFLELTKNEEEAFTTTKTGAEVDKLMDNLDNQEYAKLCSFIYNINDISEKSVQVLNQADEKSDSNKESK